MTVDHAAETPQGTQLRRPVVWFMSVAAALGTSTIYLLQPAIAEVAHSFGARTSVVGFALSCGPVGYMLGLALVVPLIDRFSPARVLAVQFGALAGVLVLCAAAGSVWVLGPVIGVVGVCSTVGAGLSSVVGRLAPPHRRATALGIVTAGISAGILAGRIVGGWLADGIGWRGMLLVFAAACAVVAVCASAVLPAAGGVTGRGCLATLRSLPGLFARYATLRLAAVRGAVWFFGFCAVWAGLAAALSEPPYSYSS
ncbi:MAG: MFS transporter, partial [Streptomycetaceae bacterium]|nr:MFS transporter [Streptomycetaceae bacterium]